MSVRHQDLLWPKRTPSDRNLHQIRQIAFSVRDNVPDLPSGLIAIYSTNIYLVPVPPPTKWRELPAIYKDHISRLISRNTHFICVHDHLSAKPHLVTTETQEILNHLRCYISYNDKVMDMIWDEARDAVNKDLMGPEWRSPALNRWLAMDYLIEGHSTDAQEWFRMNDQEDLLKDDPMRFGM